MANVVGDIAIQVGADIAPLTRELGRASGQVNRFGSTATAASGRLKAFTLAGTAMAATVIAAGAAVGALTKRHLDNIDALSKQARAVGLGVSQFQAMALVANEAGVETDKLSKLIVKMQDSVSNLAQGTTAQVEAFGRLGLSMADIGGLGADEQFRIIAERIQAIADPATRTGAALDIFGKSGAEAITMFEGYGKAVEEAAAFQREFGLAVSDTDARQIEAANDAMGRLGMATEGLGTALAVSLAPAIIAVSEGLAGLISNLTSGTAKLNDMFGSADRAAAVLGTDVYNALATSRGAVNENADAIDGLIYNYDALNSTVDATQRAITDATAALMNTGFDQLMLDVSGVGDEMQKLQTDFSQGKISAADFEKAMTDAAAEATRLLEEASSVNGVNMSDAINQVGLLQGALSLALGVAQSLRATLPGSGAGVPDSAVQFGPGPSTRAGTFSNDPNAPKTRPTRAPNNIDFGVPDAGRGGGGGGGGDNLAERLKRLQEEFQTESEQLQAQYEERLKQIEEFRQAKMLTEQQYNDLEKKAKEEHEAGLAKIEADAREARLGAVAGAFGDLASLMSSSNSALFAIGKGAAIAQATIDGLAAATSAWRKGMDIGGPPTAALFAAGSLAKTGSLIAGIVSTQANGSGGGGRGSGGGAGGASQTQEAPVQRVLVDWTGPQSARVGFEGLIDQLNEAGRRGYRINASLVAQ